MTADPKRIIGAVAERHGVLLDPDDPLLMVNTVLGLHTQDFQEHERRREARDQALLASMQAIAEDVRKHATMAPLTPKQIDEIGERVVWKCHEWSKTTADGARWSAMLWLAFCFLVFGLACGGAGYYVARSPTITAMPDIDCHVQTNGGVFCGYWASPPSK